MIAELENEFRNELGKVRYKDGRIEYAVVSWKVRYVEGEELVCRMIFGTNGRGCLEA